ncbi:MAG TPA: FHA domain-containing protein, partial [Gemmataceae bacterium]|nr:FHA domain-containing protein [Gemmataceae bacterium]
MKLHLEITAAAGKFTPFVHEGPLVRIGRSPQAELVVEGPTSDAVSWEHAEIKLTAFGALLNDLHSTNGTFVNDKRIGEQTLINAGDLIQLGNTGPVLRVLELDLTPATERERRLPPVTPLRVQAAATASPPMHKAAPQRDDPELASTSEKKAVVLATAPAESQTQRRMLLIAMCAVTVCIVALLLLVFWNKLQRPGAPAMADGAATTNADHSPAPQPAPSDQKQPEETPIRKVAAPAPAKATFVLDKGTAVAAKDAPPLPAADKDHQAVGAFEAWAKAPNILLQRESELFPWARVRPRERLLAENSLLGLPGYRSSLVLDKGVRMVLWGNVPEFGAFPPLLESVVTLHPPGPDSDADFTLDRGRVVLAMNKPNGQARIRIRFRQQIWELTLGDASTEVAVELWGLYPGDIPFGKDPVACLGLFVKGQARLRAGERELVLPNSSQVTWANTNGQVVGPQT